LTSVSTYYFIKSAFEPKIPQVKQDMLGTPPEDFALKPDVESFYMKRPVMAGMEKAFKLIWLCIVKGEFDNRPKID
jgi:hypothetical protein